MPLLILPTKVPGGITGHFQSLRRHWDTLSPVICPFGRIINIIVLFFCNMLYVVVPFVQNVVDCITFILSFLFLQFHRRIYKGIPLQFRGQVWSLLLDVPKMKEEMKDFYNVSL